MTDDSGSLPSSDSFPVEEKPRFGPQDVLPTVEPPSATFLLQLFIIPLLIVSMIVMVWMAFSWLAHAGSDPREMVKEIQEGKGVRWQRAVTLASMLGHSNSQYAELRLDPAFARQLGDILRQELKHSLSDAKGDDEALKVRYYLCRTLGQLENEEAIPPLLEAAVLERNPVEVSVRLGALEALAVLANKLGAKRFLADGKALPVLIECSRVQDSEATPVDVEKPDYRPHGELRGVAAFALGIVGGEESLNRLAKMLEDVYPTVRYNAATGLARAGDERAVDVLLEMLEPENRLAARDERKAADQDIRRIQVLKNGISATLQLVEKSPSADHVKLREAMKQLSQAPLSSIQETRAREGIRVMAKEAMNRMQPAKSPSPQG